MRIGSSFFLTALFSLAISSVNLFGAEAHLEKLKEGNERFVNNTPMHSVFTDKERKAMASGQTPFATIVACSDSRVAPELIFDQEPGDLFVVRLAGNTVDTFALASIEYGLAVLNTPLLIVLGHEDCGAVKAAFKLGEGNFSPRIAELLENIEPAVRQSKNDNPGKSHKELVDIAIKRNVKNTRQEILDSIPVAKDLQKDGKLQVKDAVFHIGKGEVEWLEHSQ